MLASGQLSDVVARDVAMWMLNLYGALTVDVSIVADGVGAPTFTTAANNRTEHPRWDPCSHCVERDTTVDVWIEVPHC